MMHYYPHHIGDFIKETANLNDHQLVTYLRMIWSYYLDEKPFSNDCESIAFAVRSDEKTVNLLLKHYFQLIDNEWHQNRCNREIEHYRSNSQKSRNAAEARWKKHKQKQLMHSESNTDAMHTHEELYADALLLDANQEPRTKNKNNKGLAKQTNKLTALKPDDVSDEVWEGWIAHRKAKKAQVTDLVMTQHREESDQVGISLNDALIFTISKGWVAFNANYYRKAVGFSEPARQIDSMMTGAI